MSSKMDAVHNPEHYQYGDFEVIDVIAQTLGPEGFKAYCQGNVIKYATRARYKDDYEADMAKAAVYADWAARGRPEYK